MNASFNSHIPDIVWEAYALGKLSEQVCASIEEHLLLCPACQDLLAEWDEFIAVIKAAVALAEQEGGLDKPLISNAGTRKRLSKGMMLATSA